MIRLSFTCVVKLMTSRRTPCSFNATEFLELIPAAGTLTGETSRHGVAGAR